MPKKQRLAWESGEGPRESRAESGGRTYRVAPAGDRAKLIITDRSGSGGPVKKSAYYSSPKGAKEAAQRREERQRE